MHKSYAWWHWRLMQNLKKNWFVVWEWHEEYGKFSPEHLKNIKLGLWWDPFIQSRKYMSLKFTEDLCHENEEWCKTWKEIDFLFQNWHEKFDEFWSAHLKVSRSCSLMGSFWTKYIMFELKKYRGVMFDGTENWCKVWRKIDLSFPKWHEEFAKFSQAE